MYRLPSILIIVIGLAVSVYSQSPHGQLLKLDCARCHSPESWVPTRDTLAFNHATTKFLLEGAHSRTGCKECHKSLIFQNAPSQCINCHTDIHSMSVGNNCARCHTAKSWLVDNIPELHEASGFPLVGMHNGISCTECHLSETNLRFDRIGNDCVNCHRDDFLATKVPNHVAVGYSTDCTECHDPATTVWSTNQTDHSFFPLTQGHDIQDCKLCHRTNNFSDTKAECASCHLNDYTATHNPNHVTAKFPSTCEQCHTTIAWSPSSFDHNRIYPLQGAHEQAVSNCNLCHANGYENTPTTCVGCHLNDYNATLNPNHQSARFATDCIQCHDERAWMPTRFVHDPVLQGAHQAAAGNCNLCHAAGYTDTPNTCAGCHLNDYNSTTNPNHKSAQFPTDCKECHDESAWSPSRFDHNKLYPLIGAHQPIAGNCLLCHASGYTNTPNTCAGCHLNDYNATTNPNHKAARFTNDCKQCHDETAWVPSSFDHNAIYPLRGAHHLVAHNCNLCHSAGYSNTPNTCVGCHLSQYNATTNPNHKLVQFPTDCKQCHDESAWVPSTFDHNTVYPLLGAHHVVAGNCSLCHANGYSNTPKTCSGCHLTDYNATTDPNHKAAQFPTDCKQCHGETAWSPSTFDHNTIYPLRGAHHAVANNCGLCHASGYTNTPNTCAGCHLNDYNATTNPNHKTAQFPTDCKVCHDETAWIPTTFDHNTIYPLLGAHKAVASNCNACHASGYTNTPKSCVGCHLSAYNGTSSPNHAAAHFPTDCKQCHNETAWVPSNFDHDGMYFPIYSGSHRGKWGACTECHTNSSNYAVFSCINCHAHSNQLEVNSDHSEVSGYTYASSACLHCHPRGY